MGTWSHAPFGNDTAKDWVWRLEEAPSDQFLFDSLKRTAGESASEEEDMIAIAAAAVVAAACREPVAGLPKEARAWIREKGFVPSAKLRAAASRAVRQISRKSALRDLWEEADRAEKWTSGLKPMLSTLADRAGCSRILRSPSPVTGRLPLPKLIKKIIPNADGPERNLLARRLATLKDVNGFVSGEWQKTSIHLLAAQGLLPEIIMLVDRGAMVDPPTPKDASAATPLELACGHGHADVAKFLLSRGARTDRQITLLDGSEFSYPQSLYSAVSSGDVPTVKLLRQHGLDLQTLEMNRCSLLHYAAQSGRTGMVRFLAAEGLELNQGDDSKWTPLHRAVMSNQEDCVRTLLELGANPNAQDDEGASPADFAVEDSHKRVARILRRNGGVSTFRKSVIK